MIYACSKQRQLSSLSASFPEPSRSLLSLLADSLPLWNALPSNVLITLAAAVVFGAICLGVVRVIQYVLVVTPPA